MRKTDKAAKQNKPSKSKVEGGGVGTLKQSKEEINNAEIQLEIAKKLAKGKGVVFFIVKLSEIFMKTQTW